MKIILVNIKWYKPFIVLIIFMQLFSCQSWILMKEPLENIIDENPEKVKIINRQQQEIKLSFPYLEGDSLKGLVVDYHSKNMFSEDTICMPVDRITKIYVEKSGAHATLMLLVIVGGIAVLLVLWGKQAVGDEVSEGINFESNSKTE